MRNKLIYINKINCIKESPDYDMEWDEDLDNLKPKDKKTLTNIKATPLPTGKVIEGSGSNYLSNEIFYRVALMRERWQARNPTKPKFPTGHFHVACVQAKFDDFGKPQPIKLIEKYRVYLDLFKPTQDEKESSRTIYNELNKLIKTVETQITLASNNITDLF